MKIDIGPYSSDLIPVRRWERNYEVWRSNNYYHDEEDWNILDRLAYKDFEGLSYVCGPINRWTNSRNRRIKIHVDSYDVWSADHTLALIIHPTLLKLKEVQHGSGHVDSADVPEHLQNDNTVHERWSWVLDEMIWAFEQCAKDDRGDNQFHHNPEQLELNMKPVEGSTHKSVSFNYQKDPAKPKYWVDTEAKKLHYDRIENGLRLFAKYYFNLWD